MAKAPRKNVSRYRKILHLKDVKKMNFREIGDFLKISRQRAQQIYARAQKSQTNPIIHDMGNHRPGQSQSS